jgi:hypothetical protein
MSNIFRTITAASFCVFLAACGGGDDDNETSGTTQNENNTGSNGGSTSTGNPSGNSSNTGSPTPTYAYDTTARFNWPSDIEADRNGNLYVLELKLGTGTKHVRRIAANGSVSTLPGTYSVYSAIALDPAGNLYVKDDRTIHRLLSDGEQTTTVDFHSRSTMAVDSQGNVYVLSLEGATVLIRKISPSGESSVFHTQAEPVAEADYLGLAIDRSDNLYSIRAVSFPARTRELVRFSPQGERTIVGPVDLTSMAFPQMPKEVASLDVDAAGNVYISSYNDHKPSPGGCASSPDSFDCRMGPHESAMSITKVTPAGVQSNIRTGPPGSTGQLSEREYDAGFGGSRVAAGPDGNLYATYEDNHTVYRITQSGDTSLYAGKAGEAGSSD